MTVKDKVTALKSRLRMPVVAAPMFLVSGPDMVIAAAKAGIMGAFPGPNGRSIDDLRAWFQTIADALGTDRLPFAFNMITHTSYGRFDKELALVSEFKPEIVITALGGPHRVTEAVHAYGGMVFADVNSPTYARKAIEKGADGLVLVCSGAGGHTGQYALGPFLDEVRGFFDGPIAVGGGISTGQAVLAVETLGADFAYVGTRFLGAAESMIGQGYRDMHSGAKAWKTVWSAGQGVGHIHQIEPMAQIIDRMATEYDAALAKLAARTQKQGEPA